MDRHLRVVERRPSREAREVAIVGGILAAAGIVCVVFWVALFALFGAIATLTVALVLAGIVGLVVERA